MKNLYKKVKACFKHSVTILVARAQVVAGIFTSVVGAMDWSPLLTLGVDTGWSWKQVVTQGLLMIGTGVLTEIARRRTL